MDGGITLEKLKVIIEAYTKPYRDEIEKVKQKTEHVASQVEKQTGRIRKNVGGLGRKAMAVLGIGAILAFGKSCLQLGSDLREVQNVVDVTFGSMNQKVNEFSRNAITQYGLSELAAKRYMGTYGSMAKSFGFTTDEVYELSSSITGLTGDLASFRNLTTDEAYTKLKSIFTGETESLKEIGVVMTQTALDQYALNEGLGKTTANMTEQEKVMLRYRFVMSSLSDASGDFARTSGSWANQVRVLGLQFESLKATIGQGLINAFTPAIRVVNALLSKLQILANYFKAFTEVLFGHAGSSSATDAMASAADSVSGSMDDAAGSAKKMKEYTLGIDELNVLNQEDESGSGGAAGVSPDSSAAMEPFDWGIGDEIDTSNVEKAAQRIKQIFENLRTFLVENKGAILATLGGLVAGIGTYMTLANWAKIAETVTKAFTAVKTGITTALAGVSAPALAIAAVVALIVAGIIDLWNTSETFRNNMTQAWELISGAFKSAWEIIWNDGLKPLGKAIAELGAALYNFYEASGLKQNFEYAVTAITWIASIIGSVLVATVSMALTLILDAITALTDAMTWIIQKVTWLRNNWTSIWESVGRFFAELWDDLTRKVNESVHQVIMDITSAWENVKLSTSRKWNDIKTSIVALWNSIRDNASQKFTAIKEKLSKIWDDVKSTIVYKWNAIKSWFSGIWTKIKNVFVPDEMKDVGKSFMNKLWDGMKEIWEDITGWLGGIGEFIGNAFDSVIEDAKELFSRSRDEAEAEDTIFDKEGYVNSGPGVAAFASGGIPETGSLFIAREAGPELVGRYGSRTGVMNNNQIVESVSDGVARAVAGVMSAFQGSDSEKQPTAINLVVDGRTLATVYANTKKRQGFNFHKA